MNATRSTLYGTDMVRVGGLSVRVRVEGAGEPLLLLNGLTRPLESWGPLAEALSGRTLVSFDAPGVGESPTPMLPLSIPMLARTAESVLDEAGFGSADVLGFSHGGAVAQQLAYQSPARVRRLVLASTTCGIGSVSGTRDALRSLRTPREDNAWPRPDVVGAFWHSLAIATWSSIPFLAAIRVPTLVVCGSRDRIAPPANSRLLARRIPDATLAMLPTGHDLQRASSVSALVEVVEAFWADHGVSGDESA
jgi:poly(3-hydroxyoctanoate) depolymerase